MLEDGLDLELIARIGYGMSDFKVRAEKFRLESVGSDFGFPIPRF